MRRVAWWGLGLVVVVALVGAGCSDDGGDDDAKASTTTTTEAADDTGPATLGPCPYTSTEAVAEAFGLPVELSDGRDDGCEFIVGDAATLLIGGDLPAGDCDPDSEVESDAGSTACLVDGMPVATVVTNEYAVGLRVTGEVAAEATRDALARLLPDVTPNP